MLFQHTITLMSGTSPISISPEFVREFCRKWHVAELSLFGSALRPDFQDESDVDFLIAFEQGHNATLEEWIAMEDELRALTGRNVDLVERRLVVNPFRRHHILTNRQILYAA